MKLASRLALLSALAVAVGCASTKVRKNPGPHDHGLRYYLPKPYLLVDRAVKRTTTDAAGGQKVEQVILKNKVDISLVYLPDFAEEYSIHARAGIGTNTTNIELQDGWRLEKIDVDVNSQATEFVKAVAGLLGQSPTLINELRKLKEQAGGGTGGNKPKEADEPPPTLTIEAHDIPLGYYESVVAVGPDGTKRLYGWRYVGFAPYANCPLDMTGGQTPCCHETDLYGLVTVGNRMYFRKLTDLANNPTQVILTPAAESKKQSGIIRDDPPMPDAAPKTGGPGK